MQEGIANLIATAKKADELLHQNLDKWEDEEGSIQAEHEQLIDDLRTFLGRN